MDHSIVRDLHEIEARVAHRQRLFTVLDTIADHGEESFDVTLDKIADVNERLLECLERFFDDGTLRLLETLVACIEQNNPDAFAEMSGVFRHHMRSLAKEVRNG
ncbi:MAG: hypothetical protein N4A53_08265 [Pelagimonas sp.]|jgi:hypothetical protein|nr:hypothetical protein [Pelagimonas sp.]